MTFSLHQGRVVMSSQVKHTHIDPFTSEGTLHHIHSLNIDPSTCKNNKISSASVGNPTKDFSNQSLILTPNNYRYFGSAIYIYEIYN